MELNEIIVKENDNFLLSQEMCEQVISIEKQIESLKEVQKNYKDLIKKAMEHNALKKIDDKVAGIAITYIAPTTREDFDKSALREINPDLYDKFVKLTPVKSSIRIKVS